MDNVNFSMTTAILPVAEWSDLQPDGLGNLFDRLL